MEMAGEGAPKLKYTTWVPPGNSEWKSTSIFELDRLSIRVELETQIKLLWLTILLIFLEIYNTLCIS